MSNNNYVELGQIPFIKDRIWSINEFKGKKSFSPTHVQIWATEKIIRVAFTSKARNVVMYKLRLNELNHTSERYFRDYIADADLHHGKVTFAFIDTNDIEWMADDIRGSLFDDVDNIDVRDRDGFPVLLDRIDLDTPGIDYRNEIIINTEHDLKRKDDAYVQANFIGTMVMLIDPEMDLKHFRTFGVPGVRGIDEKKFNEGIELVLSKIRASVDMCTLNKDDVSFAFTQFERATRIAWNNHRTYVYDDDDLPF